MWPPRKRYGVFDVRQTSNQLKESLKTHPETTRRYVTKFA